MEFNAWITLAVLAGTLALLIREKLAPELVLLLAMLTLLTLGVLSPPQAVSVAAASKMKVILGQCMGVS